MKCVILDANVLYPAGLRNTLMYLAVADVFAAKWTHQIHEEWIRNVLKARTDLTREKLETTRRLMDENARDALVEGYDSLIPSLNLPDPDDRHVLAAAIHSKASIIVTFNLKDFPQHVLANHDIQALTPDNFLMSIFDQELEHILFALREQRKSLRKPPQSATEFLETLSRQRLLEFAKALAPYKDEI